MRKKILFGITKMSWGGAQRYLFDLTTGLDPAAFEVTAMGGGGSRLKQKLEEHGTHVHHIKGMEKEIRVNELVLLWRIWKIVKQEKPDALHLNSPKMAGLGALAGRLAGIPNIIVTVHGWSFLEQRTIFERALIWFNSWMTAILAHKIIVITERDLRESRRLPFVPKKRIHYIPNGIDQNITLYEKEDARTRILAISRQQAHTVSYDIFQNSAWVGTIAELNANKDLPTFLKTVALLPPEIPAVIIGSGEEEAKLKQMAHKLGVEKRVMFLGFLPDAAKYLKAFAIFLLTSSKEGLPYVLLEAGAAKIAVVATNIGGVPDIIEHGKTGMLAEPGNARAFAKAIKKLSENPAEAEQRANALHTRVISRFSKDQMVEKTKALY